MESKKINIKKINKYLFWSVVIVITIKIIAIIAMKKTIFTTKFSDVIDNFDGVEQHLFTPKKQDRG